MIWLLALINAGLVFILLFPPPSRPRSPWDAPEAEGTDWWEAFRRHQAELAASGGLTISPAAFLALRLVSAAVCAVGAGWLLGPVSGICGAIAGWLITQEWIRTRAELRLLQSADHFREVLQSVANSLRAGRSMLQALEQAREDLARVPGRAQGLMAQELFWLLQEVGMGVPVDDAIQNMAGRIPLEEVRLFADAVGICRTRGGNLVQVLQTLIRLNVDRFQVRQEVRVLTAEKRMEGNIISLMPIGLLLLLNLLSPDYMAPLTHTGYGQALIGIGLLMVLVAFIITRAVTRIQV
ncbi:MAG: type II secretion system F family protein [Mycobacterium leprae]